MKTEQDTCTCGYWRNGKHYGKEKHDAECLCTVLAEMEKKEFAQDGRFEFSKQDDRAVDAYVEEQQLNNN